MTGSNNDSRRIDGKPETAADKRFFAQRESGYDGWIDQDGYPDAEETGPDGTPQFKRR